MGTEKSKEKNETKRRIFPAGIVREGELDSAIASALNMRFRLFMTRLIELSHGVNTKYGKRLAHPIILGAFILAIT